MLFLTSTMSLFKLEYELCSLFRQLSTVYS